MIFSLQNDLNNPLIIKIAIDYISANQPTNLVLDIMSLLTHLAASPAPTHPMENETSQKDSKSDLTMQKCQHITIKMDNGATPSVCSTAPTAPPLFSHLVPFCLDFYSGSVSLSPFKLCHTGCVGCPSHILYNIYAQFLSIG